MVPDIAINILLAGDIAIQYIGGGRYCNQYIDWLHILQYNILVVAGIAINILMAVDIAIQYIARHIYCNKYIGRSQNHQYNNNIIVRIPGLTYPCGTWGHSMWECISNFKYKNLSKHASR
jgi:hypothetical protein